MTYLTNRSKEMVIRPCPYDNRDERKVKEYLTKRGYRVEPSSRYDDYTRDIDCYVNGKGVSIKSIGINTTRLNLETWQFVRGKWEPSGWWFTGEAVYYVVWFKRGGEVVQYNKQKLLEALESGAISYKTTQLNEKTCVSQAAYGHSVIDAENWLIERAVLLDAGVGKVIGRLK